VIQLIKARFGAGQVKGVDVLRQEQLLEQSKSLKYQFEADLVQTQKPISRPFG
jgi:outer membrane protein TolC